MEQQVDNDVSDVQAVEPEGNKKIVFILSGIVLLAAIILFAYSAGSSVELSSDISSGSMRDTSEAPLVEERGSQRYEEALVEVAELKVNTAEKEGSSVFSLAGSEDDLPVEKVMPTPTPSVNTQSSTTELRYAEPRDNVRAEQKLAMMNGLLESWGNIPGGTTVQLISEKDTAIASQSQEIQAKISATGSDDPQPEAETSPIGRGSIIYAKTMMASSSDIASQAPEVIVEVLSPRRFRGARLIGEFAMIENHRVDPRLILRFSTLHFQNKTYDISALAVDPKNAEAALSDDVESHAFKRGVLFVGSALLKGAATLASAIAQNPKSTETIGSGGVTISTNEGFDSHDQTIIAVGGLADSAAGGLDALRLATPLHTIRVYEGKEIAIVIL